MVTNLANCNACLCAKKSYGLGVRVLLKTLFVGGPVVFWCKVSSTKATVEQLCSFERLLGFSACFVALACCGMFWHVLVCLDVHMISTSTPEML